MSVPCEEIRPELEALLGALTEGGLDEAGKRRLAEILRAHPEARQVYLDYCQMHALLKSSHGVLHAMALSPRERQKRRWTASLAAAAVLGIGISLVLLIRAIPGTTGSIASVRGPAWLVRGETRFQVPESGALREGDRLVTGKGGETRVRMKDGTGLRLLEETDLSFRPSAGQSRLEVKEGFVQCDVVPQPPSRPLVLWAPHAEITVLGTSFDLGAAWNETRIFMKSGRVKLASEGRSVEVQAGELGTANPSELVRWVPVCSMDFVGRTSLPKELEAVFCPSQTLQTATRKVEAASEKVHFVPGGLVLGALPGQHQYGLLVARWREELGEDLVIEADVKGGERWSLGFSVSGDSFEGYRIIFAAVEGYPNGTAIDTIYPAECTVLAVDPRSIHYDKDQTLRVERRGARIRVWVDRELRIDTEIHHPLSESRRRTFALSNFGAPPVLQRLRVFKPAAR